VRFGANTFIWASPFSTADLSLIRKVKDMGFDVIEIAVEDPTLIDVSALKNALREVSISGLICGAFGPERDLGSEDPARRDTCIRYIRECLAICEEVGSPTFAGPAYAAVGKTRLCSPEEKAQQWDLVTENLQMLGREAADRGVVISLEPLNRYETDMINTVDQALDLVNRVGSANVGIHLDTYHMNIEETDVSAAIVRTGKHLTHFHACANDRGIVGKDHVDWLGVRTALQEVGYQGPIVIESFTPGVKEIARACSIWRPVAPSQDAIARDGLAYLRELFAPAVTDWQK